AALEGVERAGLSNSVIRDIDAHPDTTRIIEKVHTADYEREFRDAARGGSRYFHSMDNPISSSTFAAARTSVAEAIAAADDIWKKRDAPIGALSGTKRAFLIARPPGHHAERAEAMGFCFFNTIACVAEWMREQPGIDRVFVFDFDVHHGNGTQALFWDRDDVFYASIHRFPFYPGTGATDEIGEGTGRGYTLNIPFEQGLGDAAYLRGMEDVIVRAIDDYQPQ